MNTIEIAPKKGSGILAVDFANRGRRRVYKVKKEKKNQLNLTLQCAEKHKMGKSNKKSNHA